MAFLWLAMTFLLTIFHLYIKVSNPSNHTISLPSPLALPQEPSPLTRRVKISTCTPRQTAEYMEIVRIYVREYATQAARAADEGNPKLDHQQLFRFHFRQYNQRARRLVRMRYQAIAEEARRTPRHARVHILCQDIQGECIHPDGRVVLAYTDDTQSFIILCPPFHRLPIYAEYVRSGDKTSTILHELTHVRSMNRGHVTRDYLPDETVPIENMWHNLTPRRALDNAYSYEYFAQGRRDAAAAGRSGGGGGGDTPESPLDAAANREASSASAYLVKLEGPLSTARKVQELASLPRVPEVMHGFSDSSDGTRVQFCEIDSPTKARLLHALSLLAPSLQHRHQPIHPTFTRLSRSPKTLSSISLVPTLGLDATMPQHRLSSSSSSEDAADPGVRQHDYPIWYFFYGRLADPDILTKQLSLSTAPTYRPARVRGGVVKRWAGKYNALVDGPPASVVEGRAYRVMTEEDEGALRGYEGEGYEVVRCGIWMTKGKEREEKEEEEEEEEVKGLTFRYCGPVAELT